MDSIEALYRQYKQDIFRYLLSLTHNQTQAEDLLSETFIHAIRSVHRFEGKSTVKTWLFGIARNLWLQQLRKEKQQYQEEWLEYYLYEDNSLVNENSSVEERLVTQETILQIYQMLQQKDARSQKIFAMRMEGYSYAEIGERLQISENSARVIDFRTRKWIREKCGGSEYSNENKL